MVSGRTPTAVARSDTRSARAALRVTARTLNPGARSKVKTEPAIVAPSWPETAQGEPHLHRRVCSPAARRSWPPRASPDPWPGLTRRGDRPRWVQLSVLDGRSGSGEGLVGGVRRAVRRHGDDRPPARAGRLVAGLRARRGHRRDRHPPDRGDLRRRPARPRARRPALAAGPAGRGTTRLRGVGRQADRGHLVAARARGRAVLGAPPGGTYGGNPYSFAGHRYPKDHGRLL